jgi:N-formylglutamate deformylase
MGDIDSDTFQLHRGTAPLLISVPHDGSEIPPDLSARMVERARIAPDTDWHVARLYEVARELGASILQPRHSRYVVDLNRPPDDTSLYPGQNTTGLCPLVQFTGDNVYLDGHAPDEAEVASRVQRYWRPYHAALQEELQRIRTAHGRVVLWEGHTIKGSDLAFLFEGRLPDLNLGTSGGASCSPALQARLEGVLASQSEYDWVANGRFKGGYITRHYAAPDANIDAVQLEMSQRTYMDEATFDWDATRAPRAQAMIRRLLEAAIG